MSLDYYMRDIRKFKILSREEERALVIKANKGDRKSEEMMINCNLRFVVSIAKQYQNQGLELEDLISEGNIGLMKALKKFDVTKNYKFITYAVWWIRQSILNSIHENAKLIRIPINKISNVSRLLKLENILEQDLSRNVSLYELADHLNDDESVKNLQYNYTMIDLDQPQTDDDKTLSNIIPDPSVNFAEKLEFVKDELEDVLLDFSEKERQILYMYYGIDYERTFTLTEIGDHLGLTRERIRQIKQQIINRLRKQEKIDELREHL